MHYQDNHLRNAVVDGLTRYDDPPTGTMNPMILAATDGLDATMRP